METIKAIDWNKMSELGLIQRINSEILHPLGLAISRNPENGNSEKILVSDDGIWGYSEQIKKLPTLTDAEIRGNKKRMNKNKG